MHSTSVYFQPTIRRNCSGTSTTGPYVAPIAPLDGSFKCAIYLSKIFWMAPTVTPLLGEIFFNSTNGAFKQGTAASSSQAAWMIVPLGMPPSADDSKSLTNLSSVSWSELNFSWAAIESQSIKSYPCQHDFYALPKPSRTQNCICIRFPDFNSIKYSACTCINVVRP